MIVASHRNISCSKIIYMSNRVNFLIYSASRKAGTRTIQAFYSDKLDSIYLTAGQRA